MTFTKTILESTFKVLQSSGKRTTLKRPVQLSKAFNFRLLFFSIHTYAHVQFEKLDK